ncbi:MAG TPA: cation-translocating P-type ATPase [Gammaproteobacteria bacterium]
MNASTTQDGSTHEAFLVINGMMCGSCAAAVEAVLLRQPGVIEAGVNFAADAAMVRWNASKTSLSQLLDAVGKSGYAATETGSDATSDGAPLEVFRRALQTRLAIAVVFGMWNMMAAILLYLSPFGVVDASMHWPLATASGVFALPVILYSGTNFYIAGWRSLRAGVPGMDTLITVAVLAAVLISTWRLLQGSADVYFDAAVMLVTFQLIARIIDHRVRRDASAAVHSYLHAAPTRVARLLPSGDIAVVPAVDIQVGDVVRVLPGERLPVDGVVINGVASLDQSMLNGERVPGIVTSGDEALAGCENLDGELTIRVTVKAGKRRIDALARSVRGLLSGKSALQRRTDRIARLLLPIVLVAAVIAMGLAFIQGAGASEAMVRALAVLIVTCPCALSLAIPLVVVMAVERSVAPGIVFRDPAVLEDAAKVKTVLFDKTGTLTGKRPAVDHVEPARDFDVPRLLQLAANTTAGTRHPIAEGLAKYANCDDGERGVVPGSGVTWTFENHHALAGRREWLESHGIAVAHSDDAGMCVHVAIDGQYAGRIGFRETLRPEAHTTVAALKQMDCDVRLLSGDNERACLQIADRLGLARKQVNFAQSPEQKRDVLQAIEATQPTLFVGDGVNDGLALASARLGVAVGDAEPTARAAAAVLLPDGLRSLPATLALARSAWKTMRQNLAWALAYNAAALPLAVMGWIHPAVAAVAMGLSTLCVFGNSLRFRWQSLHGFDDTNASRNFINAAQETLS